MIRSTSNMALRPSGRGACKRSRIVILASSEADPSSGGRNYRIGKVGCQDESHSLMVWIRLMVRRNAEVTATGASADEASANAPILRTSKTRAYCERGQHEPLRRRSPGPWPRSARHNLGRFGHRPPRIADATVRHLTSLLVRIGTK